MNIISIFVYVTESFEMSYLCTSENYASTHIFLYISVVVLVTVPTNVYYATDENSNDICIFDL